MIREHWFFLTCLIFALLVTSVNGAVFASDTSILISIKYDNGKPTIGEQFARMISGKGTAGEFVKETSDTYSEEQLINIIAITKNENTYTKNIQTPPVSNIYVSSRTVRDTDVMQITNEPGYPVLEIYWGYDQDVFHPWNYYMRVNTAGDTKAVYSEFATKQVYTKPITAAKISELLNSGVIPAWGSL